jgi:putative two-component system response regulator
MTAAPMPDAGQARVLVAEDDPEVRDVLRRLLERAGHAVVDAGSVAAARAALAQESFQLLLCDIGMPDESGLELVRQVAAELPDTAVVMVTGIDDPSIAEAAFAIGAHGYLVKPFTANEVLINIASSLRRRELERAHRFHVEELESKVLDRTLAVRQAVKRLEEAEATAHGAEQETVDRLVAALALRGGESRGQLERVSRYAALLARRITLRAWSADELRVATMLRDVGTIGVPDAILLKRGPITTHELDVVKRHPQMGYRLLAEGNSRVLALAAQIALSHHERWDGSGYPAGIAGSDIPIEGRIAAIAEAYDALTSRRVYRSEVLSPEHAAEVLRAERGRQFDPELLDAFIDAIDDVAAIGDNYPDPVRPADGVRVLVVDASGMFVDVVRRVLETGGVIVTGIARTLDEARRLLEEHGADVVVVAADLAAGWGIEGASLLRADEPDRALILLVDVDDDAQLLRAIDAGYAGCIVRNRAVDELLPAIFAVDGGEPLVSAARVVSLARRRGGRRADQPVLTADEDAVLQLMAEGLSDRAIAERLALADDAVSGLAERVLGTLQAGSRLEGVVTAARQGLIGFASYPEDVGAVDAIDLVDADDALLRAPIPLALVELSTRRLVAANAAFALLAGLDASGINGADVLELSVAEERSVAEWVLTGMASGVIDSCHLRGQLRRGDGSELAVQAWLGPCRGAESDDRALLAVVVGAQWSARAVPAALETAASRVMFGSVDHDWRWREMSTDAAELFGWEPERFNGGPLLGMVHHDDVPQLLLALGRSSADRGTAVTRVRVRGRDNEWTMVQCEVSPLCRHVPPRLAVAFRPVTSRPQQEAVPQRVSRLEQHLWRIALEAQAAGVSRLGTPTEGWWAHPTLRELSPKQLDIVVRILQGAGALDIAHELSLSPSTVRNHLTAVYRKFGVHSRGQLLAQLAEAASGEAGARLEEDFAPRNTPV